MNSPWLVLTLFAFGCSGGEDDTNDSDDDTTDSDTEDVSETDADSDIDSDADSDTDGDSDSDSEAVTAIDAYTTASSGDRLTALALVSEEGNESVVWFSDSTTQRPCSVVTAADGVERCLPRSRWLFSGVGTVYGDANCTQPATVVRASCSSSAYFRVDEGEGEAVYTSDGYYPTVYAMSERGCAPTALSAGRHAIAAVPVPQDQFVAFERSALDVDDALGVQLWTGDDGSSFVRGLWDRSTNQPAQRTDTDRVVPYALEATAFDWVEGVCGQGATAIIAPTVSPTPAYFGVREMVEPYPRAPAWEWIPGDMAFHPVSSTLSTYCNGGTANVPDGMSAYVLGDAVDNSSFPAVQRYSDTRSGQRFQHLVTAQGEPLTPFPELTAPTVLLDGQVVGLASHLGSVVGVPPTADWGGTLYGDPSCSLPLAEDFRDPGTVVVIPMTDTPAYCESLPGQTLPEIEGAWVVDNANLMSRSGYLFNGDSCLSIGTVSARSMSPAPSALLAIDAEVL